MGKYNFPRYFLLILVFLSSFWVSFLVVVISVKSSVDKKSNYYLTQSVDAILKAYQKTGRFRLSDVEENFFGSVVSLEIYGDFEHACNTLGQLDWTENPMDLQLETLTYRGKVLGILYPDFYRIEDPEVLKILVPKLSQKALEDPSFAERWHVRYTRKLSTSISDFMDISGSFLLYQRVKIFSEMSTPLDLENTENRFFADLSKTYLYSGDKDTVIKKFDYPEGSMSKRKNFLFCYIPSLQVIFIWNFPLLSLGRLISLDPVGVLLSLLIGVFSTLLVYLILGDKEYYAKQFFKKQGILRK